MYKRQGQSFNLRTLSLVKKIPADDRQLIAFVKANRGIDGSDNIIAGQINFEISAEGLRRAKALRKNKLPPSLSDRIASDKFQKIGNLGISSLSFLVSIGALIVAIIALSKGS